jgi:AcrR family transcriptional regulator
MDASGSETASGPQAASARQMASTTRAADAGRPAAQPATTSTRGPRAGRGEVSRQILHAARESFAAYGYGGTTLQGIAQRAGVDTKLVRYYFGAKEQLLAECLAIPPEFIESTADVGRAPVERRGEALVQSLIRSWQIPEIALVLRSVVLIGAVEPVAMEAARLLYIDGLLPLISEGIPETERVFRGGLIVSELLGITLSRYIYGLEQLTDVPDEQLVRVVGATLQRYIDGEL